MAADMNPLGIYRPGAALRSSGAPARSRRVTSPSPSSVGRSMAGRVSVDREEDTFFYGRGLSGMTFFSRDTYWRGFDLDPKLLQRLPSTKLMELLVDQSPDVSRALWDLLLFCVNGWRAQAFKPGTETEDPVAQAALDAFLSSLHASYAPPNVIPAEIVFGGFFMQFFMRGALLSELVLDAAGRMPLEIALPDPATIRFRRVGEPERGSVWQVGQFQAGQFVVLDRATVAFVPLHPLPGQPDGRPLAAPALFTSLFLLGLLHDLRRVITQQGYPRLDISVDFEKLKQSMPEEWQSDADKFDEWVAGVVKAVEEHYAALAPDDVFIHGDAVTVNRPVGAADSRSIGGLDGIIKVLERWSIRALKTMPLLMGVNEATTETHANRQWEIHVAGIESLQHLVENTLERFLAIALQVQGIAAVVKFRFAELRASERIRDAQAEALEIANEARKRDEGWITQDEASMKITGHRAVSATPLVANTGQTGTPNVSDTPPGAEALR